MVFHVCVLSIIERVHLCLCFTVPLILLFCLKIFWLNNSKSYNLRLIAKTSGTTAKCKQRCNNLFQAMDNIQAQPLKIYIQDIFRAERSSANKYIYSLFGLTFKNAMIHGAVTAVYNTSNDITNFEISDPTGTVQVYYDHTKSNSVIKKDMMRNLDNHFTAASQFGDVNIGIMSTLMDRIKTSKIEICEGDFLSIIGDIFLDDRSMRMISAFKCAKTCVERDIIWLEELRYLYENCYLKNSS